MLTAYHCFVPRITFQLVGGVTWLGMGFPCVLVLPTSVPPAKDPPQSLSFFLIFIGIGIVVSVIFLLVVVLWFLYFVIV